MIRPNAARSNNNTIAASSPQNATSIKPSRRPLSRRPITTPKMTGIRFSLLVVFLFAVLAIMGMASLYSMLYFTDGIEKPAPNRHRRKLSPPEVETIINRVNTQFRERYSEEYADVLYEKGVEAFGSIEATAERMALAAKENRPFVMAFSGYSITVGRGNFLNQSFPFVLESILTEPLQKILGIPLVVRNAAIGGIPSFPYGFCLEHFLGADPDVIGWDYSMNEGARDSSILEAFVRQAMQQLQKRPMLIMLDRNAARTKLLRDYASHGYLSDAIAVSKGDIVDKKIFEQKPLPPGFQEWDQFGAPKVCPGRSSWHPKRQEHAMIGWLMAMHFVKALKLAFEFQYITSDAVKIEKSRLYGKPLSPKVPDNDPWVTEILYGHDTTDGHLEMKDLSCRTSFLPATDNTKVLPSLVVSGFAEPNLDIMVDRTDEHYQEGWVLDVSKVERDTKRKVERCGGLGYIDMKIAMYGIPESGKLRLWLPYEGKKIVKEEDSLEATDWFDDIVICEANEKRSDKACKLDRDLEIMVGGESVTNIRPIKGAAEYLKRQTCVNVAIPDASKTTNLGGVKSTDGRPLSLAEKNKFGGKDMAIGLVIDLIVKSSVTRSDGACCLSHIIWEQQ